MQLLKRKGPIDYDLEVWCKQCSEPHLRSECEFRPRFGWKCPECGNKCRDKAKNVKRYPYIPRKNTTIKTDIAKERERLEQNC